MIGVHKASREELALLRIDYLKQLPEFQELYLEMLVAEGIFYRIMYEGNLAGYAVKSKGAVLLEFYLQEPYIPHSSALFIKVLEKLAIEKVYCKSFDALLLDCCLVGSFNYKLIGLLFRNSITAPSYTNENLEMRIAEESDYPFLLQQEGELYETHEELKTFIRRRSVLMFFDKSKQLVGCGYLIRIHDQFDFFDIGMWVNPDFRRRGFAGAIISYLKEWCTMNHYTPVCGCDIHNVASRKTLEKNGFISKFKLIEFRVY